MNRLLIIPAAGQGSRLGWPGPKALCPVNGTPMIGWLLARFQPFVDQVVIIVAPSAQAAIQRYLDDRPDPHPPIECAIQDTPTGMLPAILCARRAVANRQPGQVWIAWCDQVGLSRHTLEQLAAELDTHPDAACAFPTVRQAPPYIHFPRDAGGRITDVLQRREGATLPSVGESDAGLFALRRDRYLNDLVEFASIAPAGGATGERNFLPFLPWLAARAEVRTFDVPDVREAVGVNTPGDLTAMEEYLRTHE